MKLRAALIAAALTAACQPTLAAGETALLAPAPVRAAQEAPGLKTAVFAGGCFWGVEAVFSHVKGVTSAVSGFSGGTAANARYDRVSDGDTGHAEAVRVTYDPRVVRYDQLLQVFFSVVTDPTQLNRQGPDTGTQYRNALMPLSAEQNAVASAYLGQLRAAKVFRAPIVTRIERGQAFFPAEGYHQDFAAKNPAHGYIVRWDAPKVAALKRFFPGLYQATFKRG
jgi:peptide-methionine (S)-S-oxide reductase